MLRLAVQTFHRGEFQGLQLLLFDAHVVARFELPAHQGGCLLRFRERFDALNRLVWIEQIVHVARLGPVQIEVEVVFVQPDDDVEKVFVFQRRQRCVDLQLW